MKYATLQNILIGGLATLVGTLIWYLELQTYWSMDLAPPLSPVAWLFACFAISVTVFSSAQLLLKTLLSQLPLIDLITAVLGVAIAFPVVNLICGYLFAAVTKVSNVYAFPINRPLDLMLDSILLFLFGGVCGFVMWLFDWGVSRFGGSRKLP